MRIWNVVALLFFLIGLSLAVTGFLDKDLRYTAVAVIYGFIALVIRRFF